MEIGNKLVQILNKFYNNSISLNKINKTILKWTSITKEFITGHLEALFVIRAHKYYGNIK